MARMEQQGLGNPSAPLPVAVDLDGTLIAGDTLHEGAAQVLKASPLDFLACATRLKDGKAAVKRAIAQRAPLDAASLPYDPRVIDYLRRCKAEGRRIGLFTAADQSIADAVAAHLGLFDVVRGSDGVTNLSGAKKAAAITAAFGDHFLYVGDSAVDGAVFAEADAVALAGDMARIEPLAAGKPVVARFPRPRPGLATWAKALRLPHWSKNVLVFVGAILGREHSLEVWTLTLLLFVLLGCLASATYIVNDLLDLAADRAHPDKRHRPLASGAISIRAGVLACAALLAVAVVGALLFLPWLAIAVLAAYGVTTLAYSFALKRLPIFDVVCLAALFTLRILAGGTLTHAPSSWLLTFSMLFFLSLAMVKRYAELRRVLIEDGPRGAARGYSRDDLPLLLSAGTGAALSAVVIFVIYLIQEQYPRDVYAHPEFLWAMMPILLMWVLRVWHFAVHGRMSEDPVLFALKDRVSLGLGGLVLAVLVGAWI